MTNSMQPQPRPVVDDTRQSQLITRFSIALLAFTLLGMGLGSALPPQFGPLALATGSIGFIAFAILENLAIRRHRESTDALRAHTEHRLAQLLTCPDRGRESEAECILPSEILRSYAESMRGDGVSHRPMTPVMYGPVLHSGPHLIVLEG